MVRDAASCLLFSLLSSAVPEAPPAGSGEAPALLEPEHLARHAARRPGDLALVVLTLGENGLPLADGAALRHNARVEMPLASAAKVLVLAAYAREVAGDRLDPQSPVAVADWDRHHLPRTDGGAHQRALRELGLACDADGFGADPAAEVPLDALARAMIQHSDNAATDLLLERLGEGPLLGAAVAGGFELPALPLPFSGLFLAWQNHERPELDPERVDLLLGLGSDAFAAEVRRLQVLYAGGSWRRDELLWRQGFGVTLEEVRCQARLCEQLGPRGTAGDYAELLARVASDRFVDGPTSALVREHLEWPLETPRNRERYHVFGTKGGLLPELVTEVSYRRPREGDFAGSTRVVVLLLRGLELEPWGSALQSLAHQDWMEQLATRRDAVSEAARTLASPPRRPR